MPPYRVTEHREKFQPKERDVFVSRLESWFPPPMARNTLNPAAPVQINIVTEKATLFKACKTPTCATHSNYNFLD
jgi:hypothetical protein